MNAEDLNLAFPQLQEILHRAINWIPKREQTFASHFLPEFLRIVAYRITMVYFVTMVYFGDEHKGEPVQALPKLILNLRFQLFTFRTQAEFELPTFRTTPCRE